MLFMWCVSHLGLACVLLVDHGSCSWLQVPSAVSSVSLPLDCMSKLLVCFAGRCMRFVAVLALCYCACVLSQVRWGAAGAVVILTLALVVNTNLPMWMLGPTAPPPPPGPAEAVSLHASQAATAALAGKSPSGQRTKGTVLAVRAGWERERGQSGGEQNMVHAQTACYRVVGL